MEKHTYKACPNCNKCVPESVRNANFCFYCGARLDYDHNSAFDHEDEIRKLINDIIEKDPVQIVTAAIMDDYPLYRQPIHEYIDAIMDDFDLPEGYRDIITNWMIEAIKNKIVHDVTEQS